jgi:heme exporter protein C
MILRFAPTPSHESGFAAREAQRIFYLHMPIAIISYVAFTVTFICSIIYLKTSNSRWDLLASSSAEIGVVFCTLTLITGSLWGKAEWNAYWRWEDLRLVTFLILWLIFAAYLGLRNAIEEPEKRARLSAVFGVIGFVGVPLSYFSMYIWRTFHPVVVSPGGGGLKTEMGIALGFAFITIFLIYSYLLINHMKVKLLEQRLEELKDNIEGVEHG